MLNQNHSTKKIVDAGIVCGILVVLYLVSLYLPVFTFIIAFILPIPITILCIRQDIKTAILTTFASGILMAFFSNPLTALTQVLTFGVVGIILGICIKNNIKSTAIIGFIAVGYMVVALINLTVYAKVIVNTNLMGLIDSSIKDFSEMTKDVINTYKTIGIPEDKIKAIEDMTKLILDKEVFMRFIPGMFCIISVVYGYLSYAISSMILKRLKYEMDNIMPFSEIFVSPIIIFPLAIVYIIAILLNYKDITVGSYLIVSCQVIIVFMFTLDGVSLATYYMKNKFKFPKVLVVIASIFIAFTPTIPQLLGLVDSVFDFRKLDPIKKSRGIK